MLESYADFISSFVFCLRKGSVYHVAYESHLLSISLVSFTCPWMLLREPIPWDSGAPRFFVMQAFGIMVEDAVQKIYHRCGGKPNHLSRFVGYVWLSMWLIWTTPSWAWAAARALLARGGKKLPFGPLTYLVSSITSASKREK
jgi:hypothetical protein